MEITIGGSRFIAEVMDTPALHVQGLSGRDALGADRGMWFVYPTPRVASFWMRGMRFEIDIVWVSEDLVVTGVASDLPVPTSTAALPQYSSGAPIQYVLEINAGLASDLGIGPGSRVTVAPP